MMQHLVVPPRGARKKRIRVGRGNAARRGNKAGRGMNGQLSRPGRGPRVGFEGGQLPLIKGLPMLRGFTNIFKTQFSLVKLEILEKFEPGERITPELLLKRGYLRNLKNPVKVLGNGEITKAVTVVAHKFTHSAREKIQAAGGTIEELWAAAAAVDEGLSDPQPNPPPTGGRRRRAPSSIDGEGEGVGEAEPPIEGEGEEERPS